MLQFRQISKRSKSINFRKRFRNWKCQQAKNLFDHTRLYQWENYMHNLSKQYVSLYNRKWIIFLRAFIHWILKQKVIYEDRRKWVWGYQNRNHFWTFAHYGNIWLAKNKISNIVSIKWNSNFLYLITFEIWYNLVHENQHHYYYSNMV